MKLKLFGFAAAALFAVPALAAQAKTIEVTHTPAQGQYSKIMDAVNAASSGDIVEIIDNSSAFNEVVVYKKDNADFALTIRGKAGLDPRPTIKPDSSVAISNPFDTARRSIMAIDGKITLENLIIDGNDSAYDLPIDLRMVSGGTVNNFLLNSTKTDGIFAWLDGANLTINNSEFNTNRPFYHHGPGTLTANNCKFNVATAFNAAGGVINLNTSEVTILASFGDVTLNADKLTDTIYLAVRAGTTTLNNSTINGTMSITGGTTIMNKSVLNNWIELSAESASDTTTFNCTDSKLLGNYINTIMVPGVGGRDNPRFVKANLTNTLVTSTYDGGDDNIIYIQQGWDQVSLTMDNCDVIGNPTYNNSSSGILIVNVGDAAQNLVAQVNVTDTIFYNLRAGGIVLVGGAEADPSGIVEDYNVFQKDASTVFNGPASGLGAHDLELSDTDYLYADPLNSDFRLYQKSPAATLNSTGTPAYAGSQGLHPTLVPVELSTFSAE